MMRLQQSILVTIFSLFVFSVNAKEPLVVVVNKSNPIESLSKSELIDLFMGKYVAFPNNSRAIPVELEGDHQQKIDFYKKLVGMPLSSVNAYWSRLRFTGRKRAAIFKENEDELIAFIIANKQAIGYVPHSLINKDLKVIYIFDE